MHVLDPRIVPRSAKCSRGYSIQTFVRFAHELNLNACNLIFFSRSGKTFGRYVQKKLYGQICS